MFGLSRLNGLKMLSIYIRDKSVSVEVIEDLVKNLFFYLFHYTILFQIFIFLDIYFVI